MTFATTEAGAAAPEAPKGPGATATTASSAGPAAGFRIVAPNERHITLQNGLKVYLIEDRRFPLVSTRLYVRTGSVNETPDQYGISHVLEHMVFKGTANRPKGQVAKDVESLGGYLNAFTSFDKTCYLTDMPARHWKTGIDVVRDMAFFPTLDPEELEKEKPVIVSELEGNEDNPAYRLFLQLQGAILKATPYGHPIIGTRETVRAVTPESLRAYIDARYDPANMMLVVAGDMDPDEVTAYVKKEFSSFANRHDLVAVDPVDVTSLPPVADPSAKAEGVSEAAGDTSARLQVTRGKWNRVYLGLGFAVPGIRDYTSIDLDLLSYLLAGDGTSWFERKYRHELQLVDSISVDNMSMSRLGMFTVSVVLDPARVEPFFKALTEDLATLDVHRFTPKELERAKFNIEDGLDRSSETLAGLASWRASVEFDMGGRQGEANVRAHLRGATLDEIAATWKRYARPGAVAVRVLAPEDAKLPDLAAILEKNWPAPAPEKKTPAAEVTNGREVLTLENGVRLALVPDTTLPYVSVTMKASGGLALQTPSESGLATLVAESLADGCGGMDRQVFERRLAEKALTVGASAARQSFSLAGTGPSRNARDLLDLMKVMLTKPTFAPSEIAREIKDMNAARKVRDDESMSRLAARLWPALFGDHPYGRDTLGSEESLATFNEKNVRSFWDRQLAEPWVVAVAGDYDREAVIAWAKSLPKATAKPVEVAAPTWSSEKTLTLRVPERNKAHVIHLYPTVSATHPDAPALRLLDAVLSGQSGLLFSRMRDEESIGYTVTSQNLFFPTTGLTLFYTGTEPDKVAKADEGFAKILAELKEKELPAELLAAGCNTLEGRYVRSRQSLGSRCGEVAREILLGLPQDFAWSQIEAARKVTPAQLRDVARRYFKDGYVAKALP